MSSALRSIDEAAIAALADPVVDGPRLDPRALGEQLLVGVDDASERRQPLGRRRLAVLARAHAGTLDARRSPTGPGVAALACRRWSREQTGSPADRGAAPRRRASRRPAARHRPGRFRPHRGAGAAPRGSGRGRGAARARAPPEPLAGGAGDASRAGRGARRAPPRRALDRNLGGGRRAAAARVPGRGRARSVLRDRRPGRPAGDPARPPRSSCRCAVTRSAATPPACWPACCAGSMLLKAEAVAAPALREQRGRSRAGRRQRRRARAGRARDRVRRRSTRATTGSSARPAASTAATSCSSWRSCFATAPTSPPSSAQGFATCSSTSSRTPASPIARCSTRWSARRQRRRRLRSRRRRCGAFAAPARPRARGLSRDLGRRRPTVELPAPPARAAHRDRFWRCENERAQAQAVAREIEHLLAAGEVRPEQICVVVGSGWREARLVAAALEERSVPFRFAGDAAFFAAPRGPRRARLAADARRPGRRAAVVRALTRPPVELRSVDLARCTTIARRRKLDMVSALEAALESPQLPPEARDRIQAFLRLHSAAARAIDEMRADVFVRRLIERSACAASGCSRRSPEAAERLRQPLAPRRARRRLGAARAARLDPRLRPPPDRRRRRRGLGAEDADRLRPPGAVVVAEPEQVKGLEFDHVYLLGLSSGAVRRRGPGRTAGSPRASIASRCPRPARSSRRRRRGCSPTWRSPAPATRWFSPGRSAPSRAADAIAHLCGGTLGPPRRRRGAARGGALRAGRGPALHLPDAPRRGARGVLAGRLGALGDAPRHRRRRQPAVARFLELVKLAALIQRPGGEPARGGDRRDQRAARPGRVARAARRARRLGARRLPARRGARARRAAAG